MADVQHIAELGFDISAAYRQFEELERLAIEKSTKIGQLVSDGLKLDMGGGLHVSTVSRSLGELEKEVAHSYKRMGMSWKTAKNALLDEGNTGAGLTDYFKKNGKKMAVEWTQELENHFKNVAPELKRSLSYYIDWTKDGSGMPFDRLTNDLREQFAPLADIGNHLDMLQQVNEAIVRYRELMTAKMEGGHAARLKELEEAANGSAGAIGRIVEAYEKMHTGAALGDKLLSPAELQAMADHIRDAAQYQTQLTLETDKNGQLTGATVTYVDELNNKYREQWKYVEEIGDGTDEMVVGFERVKGVVTESTQATKSLANEFARIETALARQNEGSTTHFTATGNKQQLEELRRIQAEVKKIKSSSFAVTREQVQQLRGLKLQSDYIARVARAEQGQAAAAKAVGAEQSKVLALYMRSADVQAKMRKQSMDNTGLYEQAGILRNELQLMAELVAQNDQLTAGERKRLEELQRQLGVIQAQVAIGKADASGPRLDDSEAGILGRAGAWFGAYSVWHTAKRAGKETVGTMRDVELAMVDIARVLDLTSGETRALRDEIFGLADDFAREFDSAADIYLRFAQGGYDVRESVELTRSALLAMNTAELDAENSTRSLIGILKQWGYSADELTVVIDKLNYTSDNNTVTTQDLVDALLRSSAAANAAKFSFEETVGAIVAVGEASGRSGREIGTALNSLISYTQKASSLDTFESLGVRVWLDEEKTQLNSIMDVWQQLALLVSEGGDTIIDTLERQTEFSALFTEEIAAAAGAQEEYNAVLELEHQLNDTLLNDAEKKTVQEQFGVYRRNYMIALLNNFAKVQEVATAMQDAEGHSMQENSRHMETLEAKYTQLITSLKELAVVAGDAGFMDLAKGAVAIAKGLLGLTKNVVSLKAALVALAAVIALIKRERVATGLTGMVRGLQTAKKSLVLFVAEVKAAGGGVTAFKTAVAGMSMTSWIGAISAATAVLGLLAMTISNVKAKAEEARREREQAARGHMDEAKSLQELRREYVGLIEDIADEEERNEALAAWKERLIELYGFEREALEGVNDARETGLALLDEEMRKQADATLARLGGDYKKAVAAMEAEYSYESRIHWDDTLPMDEYQDFYNLLQNIGATIQKTEDGSAFTFGLGGDLEEYKEQLEAVLAYFNTLDAHDGLSAVDDMFRRRFQSIYDKDILPDFSAHAENYQLGNEAQAIIDFYDYIAQHPIKDVNDKTFGAWKDGLLEAAGSSEAVKAILAEMADDTFPKIAYGAKEAFEWEPPVDVLGEWMAGLAEAEDAAKGLETGIRDLESAMEKLAEAEGLTLDETLALLDAFPELAHAIQWQGDEWYFSADAMEAVRQAQYNLRFEQEAYAIATEIGAGLTAEQRDRLYELIQELTGASTATARQAAMVDLMDFANRNAIASTDGLAASLAKLQLFAAGADNGILESGRSYSATPAPKSSRGGGGSKQDPRIKELQDLQKATEKSYKAQEEAVKKRYNTEIDALKRLKEEHKRGDDREDYEKKRAELVAERGQMEQRTSREAVERIKAIDKELVELDQKETRRQRDNSIDDQISSLEERRDAELEAIKAAAEAAKESYQQQIEQLRSVQSASGAAAGSMMANSNAVAGEVQKDTDETSGKVQKGVEELTDWVKRNLDLVDDETKTATNSAEGYFWHLYKAVMDDSDIAARHQIERLAEVFARIESVRQAMMAMGLAPSPQNVAMFLDESERRYGSNPYGGQQRRTNSGGGIPTSHTGSIVAKDGLVNVGAGEIIVREDISAGLLNVVDYFNRGLVGGGTRQMLFYGPLQNVEHQAIADSADARRAAGDVGSLIMKQLNRLPR